MINKKTKHNK